jgi:hypothetical protein
VSVQLLLYSCCFFALTVCGVTVLTVTLFCNYCFNSYMSASSSLSSQSASLIFILSTASLSAVRPDKSSRNDGLLHAYMYIHSVICTMVPTDAKCNCMSVAVGAHKHRTERKYRDWSYSYSSTHSQTSGLAA